MRLKFAFVIFLLTIKPSCSEDSVGDCHFGNELDRLKIGLSQCDTRSRGQFTGDMTSNRMADILCTGAQCSPTEKRVVKDLTAQLNPGAYQTASDVGVSNRGLKKFFRDQTRTHPCFGELAFRFYSNPALLRDAGSDLNTPGQNGETWDLAMRTAGNNPNLAMELIAACGNDDSDTYDTEGDLSFCGDPSHILNLLHESGGKCGDAHDSKKFTAVQYLCPLKRTSFFRPEGLPGTRVTQDFKEELAKSYAPNVSLSQALGQIPHKNYHIYGSAYLTCQMIQQGMPARKAVAVERETSIIYRAVRVCTAAVTNTTNFNTLLGDLNLPTIDFSDSPSNVLAQWNKSAPAVVGFLQKELKAGDQALFSNIGLLPQNAGHLNADDLKALGDKVHDYPGIVLAGFLTGNDIENSNPEEQVSRLQPDFGDTAQEFSETLKTLRAQVDSKLLRLGKRFAPKVLKQQLKSITENLPCVANAASNFATRHEYQCSGFAGCDAAKRKLLTYKADFNESSEYHRLGSEFAAKNCSRVQDVNTILDQQACSALNRLQNETVGKRTPHSNSSADKPE